MQDNTIEDHKAWLASPRTRLPVSPAARLVYWRARYRRNTQALLASWLNAKYGISVATFDAILASQKGVCAVCKSVRINKAYHIDCVGNAIRGVLCQSCAKRLPEFSAYLKT